MQSVFCNKDILTHVLSYLDNTNWDIKQKINLFRRLVHYDYIRSANQLLLYGPVQSGKTSKIMDFITKFKQNKVKVLVIQNNVLMLAQYIKSLSQRGITYKIIATTSKLDTYNGEQVLITINNKFRIQTLNTFIKNNQIHNYALILDESDQYLNKLKSEYVFKASKDILHVTATPFIYASKFQTDQIIKLNPKWNYVGLNQIQMKEIRMYDAPTKSNIGRKIRDIIRDDFICVKEGIMLINCFAKIIDMNELAFGLSYIFTKIPIIVFSNKTHMYLNGPKIVSKVRNVQQFIDKFTNIKHVIFIAGRLSSRGINYTNTDYSRYITHQISLGSDNYTNFIQKCRIFGNRNIQMKHADNSIIRPTIYCIITKHKHEKFVENLMLKVNMLDKMKISNLHLSLRHYNVKELILLCKKNNIHNYSGLKKNEIIELLGNNKIE
jgi:hypothetical protein